MKHYGWQDHQRCPLCNYAVEKISHFLHCPDVQAVITAKAAITGPLQARLDKQSTQPSLSTAIVDIYTKLRTNRIPYRYHYDYCLAGAIAAQQKIGWDNWLLGRWSPKWQEIQAAHYTSIGSKRTSHRWATAIINQFFLTSWDLWKYRNERLHGSTGSIATAQHASLNIRIDEEYALGSEGMAPSSRHFLRPPIDTIKSCNTVHKQQWLSSVNQGRQAHTASLHTAPPAPRVSTALRDWLATA